MSNLNRKLGDKLELTTQLYDGEASLPKVVKVRLTDSMGVLLEPEFTIPHVSGGIFAESTRTMPSNSVVKAQFFVYNSDGITLDTKYSVALDIYMRDFSAEIIDNNLDAKVSSVGGGSGLGFVALEIEGDVETPDTIEGITSDAFVVEGLTELTTSIEGEIEEIQEI